MTLNGYSHNKEKTTVLTIPDANYNPGTDGVSEVRAACRVCEIFYSSKSLICETL
jgi:hypothetical protein